MHELFSPYLSRWNLLPDGEEIVTHSSRLLPVAWQGAPAMLKVALEKEERRGGLLLPYWSGEGAVQVFEAHEDAVLMERVTGERDLATMPDPESAHVLCSVTARLHEPRDAPMPASLVPLEAWFRELWLAATSKGGFFSTAAEVARDLLDSPQEVGVLHGDIHHGNVLDGGERGWLAIDPKGLIGERGFDFANLFCNPSPAVALAPGRVQTLVERVSIAAGLERKRLLQWVVAYCGLSAAWTLSDGGDAHLTLTVGHAAVVLLQ